MAINLGDADKQKEIANGPIPKKSMVKVKIEIRQPKNPDPQDPAVTVFKSGLKGLDCELTVISGQFEGVRIWENWFLPPQMQNINMSKGQVGACNGGFAKCRAAIEAARRIDPDDATANRNIEAWFDLHGLEIPVKVGIDKPEPGDRYINNNVAKILSVKDAEFETVQNGGEIVTDEPIPEIPESKSGNGGNGANTGWGQNGGADTGANNTEKQMNVPAWAQGQGSGK